MDGLTNPEADSGKLVLGDGTVIDTTTGSVAKPEISIPSSFEIIHKEPAITCRIADLPIHTKQFNAICVVIGYTMLGVDDASIASSTGISVETLQLIRASDGYKKVFDSIVDQIMQSDQQYVRNVLTNGSKNAAHKVLELVDSDNEATAIIAAKDVLDRGGHRPADVIEHRHRLEGGLRIEVVQMHGDKAIPQIDLDAEGHF